MIDLRLARLRVLAQADGAPAPTSGVQVSALGRLETLGEVPEGLGEDARVCWDTHLGVDTDKGGVLEVALSPGREYGIVIDDPRYEQYWQLVPAPGAGETLEHIARLEPRKPKPRMVVVLETPEGDVPTKAGFGFYAQQERPDGSTPFPVRNVAAENGRFLLDDLIPGRFRMHVRAGREWGDRPGDWAEAVADVEVPASGEVHRRIEITRGGRLQLDVVDTEGRPWRPTVSSTPRMARWSQRGSAVRTNSATS